LRQQLSDFAIAHAGPILISITSLLWKCHLFFVALWMLEEEERQKYGTTLKFHEGFLIGLT
jgi:hypothetical protein